MNKKIIIILASVVCLVSVSVAAGALFGGGSIAAFKNKAENGELNKPGELLKSVAENNEYNTPFDDLPAYSYELLAFYLRKKPSSIPKIEATISSQITSLDSLNDVFPIKKLSVINDDCIFAEYKLDKGGKILRAYAVLERSIRSLENGEDYEYWKYCGELYFAYPELNAEDFSDYKGRRISVENLPCVVDLNHAVCFGEDEEDEEEAKSHSEETVMLNDGYLIFDYTRDYPDSGEITVTDVKFIPYGETNDEYPYNSLIKYAFVPEF